MRKARRQFWLVVLAGVPLALGLVWLGREGLTPLRGEEPVFRHFVSAIGPTTTNAKGSSDGESRSTSRNGGNEDDFLRTSGLPRQMGLPADRALLKFVDEHGRAIPNAKLRVEQRPNFELAIHDPRRLGSIRQFDLSTDADGITHFSTETGSSYDLLFRADGFAPQWYRAIDPGVRYIEVAAGAAVWGRVLDETGAPLSGIRVEVEHEGAETAVSITDSNGEYAVNDLAPGVILVTVSDPEYERALRALTAEPGSRYQREIRLRRGGRLQVDVSDVDGNRLEGARVSLLELNSGRTVARRESDAAGRATFSALLARRSYLVDVSAGEKGCGRSFVTLLESRDDVAQASVTVTPVLSAAGRITTKEGLGVPGAKLLFESEQFGAFGTSRHYVEAVTDQDGAFAATGFHRDTRYTMLAYHEQFAIGLVDANAVTASLEGRSPLDFSLLPPSRVRGVIRNADGATADRAVVVLSINDPTLTSIGHVLIGRTGSDGTFDFSNLPPGRIWIDASSVVHGRTNEPKSQVVQEQGVVELEIDVSKP